MNILVTNVYSYKNKGDAAIVVALIGEIRRAFPGTQILIQTTDVANDDQRYGEPVSHSLLWLLLSAHRRSGLAARVLRLIRGLTGLLLFLALRRWFKLNPTWLLTTPLRQFVREQSQADLVIACGGGYLRTAGPGPSDTLLLLVTCLNFVTGAVVGRPVYLYSQSIGPVHGWLQCWLLAWALRRVRLIEVREDISERLVSVLHLPTRVVPTADPVFLLRGQGTPPPLQLRRAPLRVGVTVRQWFGNDTQLERYIAAMAQTIDYLIVSHQAEVYYVPQVIAANFGDDDRVIAERVRRQVRRQEQFTLISDDLDPLELVGLCGQFDLFIGTRMHSNIFALINAVPVVAIEYEHKTRGIMRGLGLEELVIPIADVDPDSLRLRVETVLARRDHYRELIERSLDGATARSRLAIEAIQQDYDDQLV